MDPCLDRYLLILKFIWWQGALILDCHWWITFIGPEDLDKHSTFWLRFPSGWLASMLPPPSFLTRLMRAQPRLDCGVYGSSRKNIPDTKISKGQRFPFSTINSFSGVINSFLGSLAGVPGTSMVQRKSIMEPFKNCLGTSYRALVLIFINCDWLRVTGAGTYCIWGVVMTGSAEKGTCTILYCCQTPDCSTWELGAAQCRQDSLESLHGERLFVLAYWPLYSGDRSKIV